MKCNRHEWDTDDKEWCWQCEELTMNEIKKTYEKNRYGRRRNRRK